MKKFYFIFLYFKIVIGTNGVWGTNFEHTVAEAVPHAVMNDHILRYM